METNVVKERLAFVHDLESGHWWMTELCECYGVSRPTGDKWVARHQAGDRVGLDDRSRAPQRCPHRTSEAVEELFIAAPCSTAGPRKSCCACCVRGTRVVRGRRAVR